MKRLKSDDTACAANNFTHALRTTDLYMYMYLLHVGELLSHVILPPGCLLLSTRNTHTKLIHLLVSISSQVRVSDTSHVHMYKPCPPPPPPPPQKQGYYGTCIKCKVLQYYVVLRNYNSVLLYLNTVFTLIIKL